MNTESSLNQRELRLQRRKERDRAQVSMDGNDGKRYTLTMFNNIITEIVDGVSGSDLRRRLMSAPVMRFSVDNGDVVYSVKKL